MFRFSDVHSNGLWSTVTFPPMSARFSSYSVSAGESTPRNTPTSDGARPLTRRHAYIHVYSWSCPHIFGHAHTCLATSTDIPGSGLVQQVLPISYTISNKTALIQEFEAKMGTSEAFMCSGNKQVKIASFLGAF